MFEAATAMSTADLAGLLVNLAVVEEEMTDAERIDRLELLERVKAVSAAAQARLTVGFVTSQSRAAQDWLLRAETLQAEGDVEGWTDARARARAAGCPELTEHGQRADPPEGEKRADRACDGPDAPWFSRVSASVSNHGRLRRPDGRPRADWGVAAQVALARRVSPWQGSRHVSAALVLLEDLPETFRLLESGLLSERRAELVVQETRLLTAEQRQAVDAELATTVGDRLASMGLRELAGRVQAIAYRIAAEVAVRRCAHAESERRVTIRPAPDTMAWVTALLPVVQGVAVHAALTRAAAVARASGDERTKGQLMADLLVERVTGQPTAAAVPVEIQLVMTDRSLLRGDDIPAEILGYGPLPAQRARDLVAGGPTQRDGELDAGRAWLRRLYTHPGDGTLVAMDSRRRLFDGGLRRFLVTRDGGRCFMPGCDAPIRHLDHIRRHAEGGRTEAANGQGACTRDNQVKELPGWRVRTVQNHPRGPRVAEIETPTGHTYRSQAPPVLPWFPTSGGFTTEEGRGPAASAGERRPPPGRWELEPPDAALPEGPSPS